MTDLPCDDLSCICCHPEEQHSCRGPEYRATEPYTCPECGVTWTRRTGRPRHWPASMKWDPAKHCWWEADGPIPTKAEIAARGDAS